ncbi:glucan biosynthesis protein G [Methylophaga sp. SB9B]|uniref:glucan biosynthesis protein G n=1 Tax=Methylophaga sp. SB9B TaxID=2570356 RepID=UPI0010A80535|nr:glucan biosynthesis protein G [Methylophaga sp. SB9B]THK40685.1 glucan biosynthesis protein G [Methylophaga sp. SB9B]
MLSKLSLQQNFALPQSLMSFSRLIIVIFTSLFFSTTFAETSNEQVDGTAFSHDTVIEYARKLAEEPFKQPKTAPEELKKLDYSTYRQINFLENAAIWGGTPTKFSVQLFAPGFLYQDLIDIDVVESGKSFPLELSENSFRVPNEIIGKKLTEVGKYAGLRLHYPLNNADYQDEFIVFQGASYFRVVSKGQLYGISARGLAIDVGQPKGEEFPIFKRFWIERPSSKQNAIVVHALLDSKSVTGAYRFGIHPGSPSKVDVQAILFPRTDVKHVGLAPLTSMFMHGGMDRPDQLDYRPAVHDSEGLQMRNGQGERIWRPLNNPQTLQISAFIDENPKGFGLIQRNRDFAYYQDLEANYHQRPSAWIEPVGDWGKGQVELVEIPSASEENDNIVAYWKPENGLKKGEPFEFAYTLTSPDDVPTNKNRPRIVGSASGLKLFDKNKEILIDYSNINSDDIENIDVIASISQGKILESRIEANPHINGARVVITFDSQDADVAELRVQLNKGDKQAAPTWLYRWLSRDWNNSL